MRFEDDGNLKTERKIRKKGRAGNNETKRSYGAVCSVTIVAFSVQPRNNKSIHGPGPRIPHTR